MWFHWCYCFLFSVLFSVALLLLFLHIFSFYGFFFGFLSVFTKFFLTVVLFQGHLSPLSAAFSGCFFGLFCPVLLGGGFLALHRVPISSDWFFGWHSLRPSSTQLLVCNCSGVFSHWYLAGLLFLLGMFFTDCASVFHPAFLLSASVLSSGL